LNSNPARPSTAICSQASWSGETFCNICKDMAVKRRPAAAVLTVVRRTPSFDIRA
jgi:hypothetical protein